jgi:hypothetical protein
VIPLHHRLVAALKEWKETGWQAYVGRAPKDDDWIFPDPDGKLWRPRSAELLRDQSRRPADAVQGRGHRYPRVPPILLHFVRSVRRPGRAHRSAHRAFAEDDARQALLGRRHRCPQGGRRDGQGHESGSQSGNESSEESSEERGDPATTVSKDVKVQQFAPVAQWIEQRFPKPLVGRSSRLGGAP